MTDAALLDLAYTIASTKHPWAMQYVEAIRSLRDAARAVCDSCQDQFSDGYSIRHFTVDEDKVNELRQLLPKEPQ